MNKRFFGIILSLFLTACAQTQWVKPGATEASFNRDKAECEYEATKAVPDTGTGSVIAIAFERANLMKQCLRIRGYSQE